MSLWQVRLFDKISTCNTGGSRTHRCAHNAYTYIHTHLHTCTIHTCAHTQPHVHPHTSIWVTLTDYTPEVRFCAACTQCCRHNFEPAAISWLSLASAVERWSQWPRHSFGFSYLLQYAISYTTYFQNQALKNSMLNGIDTIHNHNTILTLAKIWKQLQWLRGCTTQRRM